MEGWGIGFLLLQTDRWKDGQWNFYFDRQIDGRMGNRIFIVSDR